MEKECKSIWSERLTPQLDNQIKDRFSVLRYTNKMISKHIVVACRSFSPFLCSRNSILAAEYYLCFNVKPQNKFFLLIDHQESSKFWISSSKWYLILLDIFSLKNRLMRFFRMKLALHIFFKGKDFSRMIKKLHR